MYILYFHYYVVYFCLLFRVLRNYFICSRLTRIEENEIKSSCQSTVVLNALTVQSISKLYRRLAQIHRSYPAHGTYSRYAPTAEAATLRTVNESPLRRNLARARGNVRSTWLSLQGPRTLLPCCRWPPGTAARNGVDLVLRRVDPLWCWWSTPVQGIDNLLRCCCPQPFGVMPLVLPKTSRC